MLPWLPLAWMLATLAVQRFVAPVLYYQNRLCTGIHYARGRLLTEAECGQGDVEGYRVLLNSHAVPVETNVNAIHLSPTFVRDAHPGLAVFTLLASPPHDVPILLDRYGISNYLHLNYTLYGWHEHDVRTEALHAQELTVDQQGCAHHRHTLCIPEVVARPLCRYDFGSPLVHRTNTTHLLVGIKSWCSVGASPHATFVTVASHHGWLHSIWNATAR